MKIRTLCDIVRKNILRPQRVIASLASLNSKEGILKRVSLPNGMEITLLLPAQVSLKLYLQGSFEEDVQAYIRQITRPGNVFFDCGANIGYHTLAAIERVGSSGKVVAFEPIDALYNVLEMNTRPYRNVRLEMCAVSEGSSSSLTLNYYGLHYSCLTTSSQPRVSRKMPQPKRVNVRATSIDQYVEATGIMPDIIKLDIEGSEMDALRGSELTIIRNRPYIIIECGDIARTHKTNSAACLKFLRAMGYRFQEYDPDTREIVSHKLSAEYPEPCNILCTKR
jgi:FkbM family methyltransferase